MLVSASVPDELTLKDPLFTLEALWCQAKRFRRLLPICQAPLSIQLTGAATERTSECWPLSELSPISATSVLVLASTPRITPLLSGLVRAAPAFVSLSEAEVCRLIGGKLRISRLVLLGVRSSQTSSGDDASVSSAPELKTWLSSSYSSEDWYKWGAKSVLTKGARCRSGASSSVSLRTDLFSDATFLSSTKLMLSTRKRAAQGPHHSEADPPSIPAGCRPEWSVSTGSSSSSPCDEFVERSTDGPSENSSLLSP